ncbi:NAD(P)/FAD-dependent oxidoreductase [Pseudonocardia xishanensis]|uniref:NAD(P)/FAD-dependent oxidoreductase n=1 Tax=Pseudonocardia xishanensis TaxID=630995 RepID=A0ABP8S344_9PSEU
MSEQIRKQIQEQGPGRREQPPGVEFVRCAVEGADPVALRTALYQATGDRTLLDMVVEEVPGSPARMVRLRAEHRLELVERAVRFLLHPPPVDVDAVPDDAALRELLELTLAMSLDDETFELTRPTAGFADHPRDVRWTAGRPELPPGFEVAIVGAGISGVAMGVQLARLGIPFTVFERRDEVGGVWSTNTYPDARVDTSGATYEYRFVKKHPWTEHFPRQPEVRAYVEKAAREHGVLDRVRLGHDVVAGEFDQAGGGWVLTVRDRDGRISTHRCAVVVTASGVFATPKELQLHGIERFEGEVLHTTEWSSAHTARGKRVAVVGNGSTGVQLLGRIAQEAEHVEAFVRTPQWISPRPRYGELFSEEETWLFEHMPFYWNWTRVTPLVPYLGGEQLLVPDPEWQRNGGQFSEANDAMRAALTAYIRAQTGDRPDLVERLVPDYAPMARRMIVDNNWYSTLTLDHVDLVTDPIERVEPDGIVTADGRRHPLDMILGAVGFEVTKYLWPTEYVGRDGIRLADVWGMETGGPRAYAGVSVPGFPNMFMLYGPNSQPTSGGLGLHGWIEIWCAHVAQALVAMLEGGHRTVEVTQEAFDDYNRRIDDVAAGMIWSDPGSNKVNYYVNETGRLQQLNPLPGVEYFSYLKEIRDTDYRLG